MKNISELVNCQVAARQEPQTQSSIDAVAQIFNSFFKQLVINFPGSIALLKDEESKTLLKQQWLQAFKENGINKLEYIKAGMTVARRQNTDFLPSPGKFISWCKDGISEQIGLPTASELVEMTIKFAAEKGIILAEDYPFPNNACYWIVTSLYCEMRERNLSAKELEKLAQEKLTSMTNKILNGYVVPEPVKQIASKPAGVILTRDESLKRLSEIKRKFLVKNERA
ncbi:MAG: hypothetical protein [Caudoviricetes sp.]|nr:MAG: hypothetical protein [Caudoviricetes sp.]